MPPGVLSSNFMEKTINSPTKILSMFCPIIRILRLSLFLYYQLKMEGRLISQHFLRQHAGCNYITQVPIERLISQKETLKDL
jgi:hypothetical protein